MPPQGVAVCACGHGPPRPWAGGAFPSVCRGSLLLLPSPCSPGSSPRLCGGAPCCAAPGIAAGIWRGLPRPSERRPLALAPRSSWRSGLLLGQTPPPPPFLLSLRIGLRSPLPSQAPPRATWAPGLSCRRRVCVLCLRSARN
eukprot:scaffold28990_cov63-Phaeocystis_antarctica.AAC.3